MTFAFQMLCFTNWPEHNFHLAPPAHFIFSLCSEKVSQMLHGPFPLPQMDTILFMLHQMASSCASRPGDDLRAGELVHGY